MAELTPNERARRLAAGADADRLPCVPIVGNTAARVIGCRVRELRYDAALLANAQVAAYRAFGYDNIRIFTDLYPSAEAMGAKVYAPDDETAYLALPAIQEPGQIDTLRPADPQRDGILPLQLEALRRALDVVGDEVPVTAALTGPFTVASFLVGAETLTRLVLRSPSAAARLCDLALETTLRLAEAIMDSGGTPSLTDAMSSATVISPRTFEQFSLPGLRTLVEYIHGRGKKVTLHICGKTQPIWPLMVATGADCLSLDNDASLAAAKTAVGDQVKLMGNVHPAAVMLQGTPLTVRAAVREVVAAAGDSPKGLIVASGCSLPTETPFENIRAMLDAVREIGFPVNRENLQETHALARKIPNSEPTLNYPGAPRHPFTEGELAHARKLAVREESTRTHTNPSPTCSRVSDSPSVKGRPRSGRGSSAFDAAAHETPNHPGAAGEGAV
ncbi:MAG: uroporphyrinogen decarboxylase family protein [Verrucomicrobiales bacterium]|jgi:uroporphyrinogen decarboxylase|nr:uroporphyrinogen decarboxylase family protein [Verrucomicrobiales bacterium]